MKCNHCRKELPDDSQFCNHCGHKQSIIQQTIVLSNVEKKEENPKAKNEPFINAKLLIGCGIAIIILILLIALPSTSRNSKFDEAVELVHNGRYENAIDLFEEIKGSKHSEITEFVTDYFDTLCAEGNYSGADSWLLHIRRLDILPMTTTTEMRNRVNYVRAMQLAESGDFVEAYNQLILLGDYEDSSDKAAELWDNHKDAFYRAAVSDFDTGYRFNLISSKDEFERLGDYEDSKEYLEKIDFLLSISGTYRTGSREAYIIDINMITSYSGYDSKITHKLTLTEYDGELCLFADYENSMGAIYVLRDGKTYWHLVDVYNDGSFSLYYDKHGYNDFMSIVKTSDSTDPIKEPAIGMTAEEVESSTWGKPEKINKSTYSWGTSEQWVYSGYRYIYLDNGIVTAIQE